MWIQIRILITIFLDRRSFRYSSVVLFTFEMDDRINDEIYDFDPTKYGLQDSFRLTDYANLKGWGCKVPQKILLKLLEGLKQKEEKVCTQFSEPIIGIGPFLYVLYKEEVELHRIQTSL